MGKRSSFERVPRDFYPTPVEAVAPLLPHLAERTLFIEPCAGDGRLIQHLTQHGHCCVESADIDVAHQRMPLDARTADYRYCVSDCFITNPPWSREILHPIITNLSAQAPTWLLFDADWMHTRQSAPFMPILRKIVSVGRVKWIADSPFTGKDNCCWYLFDARENGATEFVGRAA